MSTQMGMAAYEQPPAERFRVPSPPQGFKVPSPSEMVSAIMEPLDAPDQAGTPGTPPPGVPLVPGGDPASSQGQAPMPAPGEVPVVTPGAQTQGGDSVTDPHYGQAPGRASSIGPDAVGQKFPDFVAPAGPMLPPDQQGSAAQKSSVGKGALAGVAVLCLLIGGGGGFLVGRSTAASGAAEGESAPITEAKSVAPADPDKGPSTAFVADAATAKAASDKMDGSVAALALVLDAGSAAGADPTDAATKTPATAITPAVPDPGEPGAGECALTLKVVPSDAAITINALKLERGATKVNVPCGVYPLTITHAKYKKHKGSIVLKSSRITVLEHRLRRPLVRLEIISIPSRALVTLAGEDLGRTPIKRKIPAYDPIELKLVRRGYKAHQQTIEAQGTTKLRIKLKRRRRRGGKHRRPSKKKSLIKL